MDVEAPPVVAPVPVELPAALDDVADDGSLSEPPAVAPGAVEAPLVPAGRSVPLAVGFARCNEAESLDAGPVVPLAPDGLCDEPVLSVPLAPLDDAEDPSDDGSAEASPHPLKNAAPTPSATANPPTRPTYFAPPIGSASLQLFSRQSIHKHWQ